MPSFSTKQPTPVQKRSKPSNTVSVGGKSLPYAKVREAEVALEDLNNRVSGPASDALKAIMDAQSGPGTFARVKQAIDSAWKSAMKLTTNTGRVDPDYFDD